MLILILISGTRPCGVCLDQLYTLFTGQATSIESKMKKLCIGLLDAFGVVEIELLLAHMQG